MRFALSERIEAAAKTGDREGRTVEWRLHKVFTKLSITSRKGLKNALRVRSRQDNA